MAIKTTVWEAVESSGLVKNPITFSAWVSQTILDVVGKDKFLKTYAPNLSLASPPSPESLIIRDKSAKGERLAEITIRNRKIWCSLDNSEDCDHIHFALAIPEFGRLVKS